MQQLAEELRRGLLARSDAIRRSVSETRGRLGATDLPIAGVLDLFGAFPSALDEVVEAEWNHNTDPESRVQILRALLIHTTSVATFVHDWLSHDIQSEIPLSLQTAVSDTCEELGPVRSNP
jgi:hypothetical protein